MNRDRSAAELQQTKRAGSAEPEIPSARRPKAAKGGIAAWQAACAAALAQASALVRSAMAQPSSTNPGTAGSGPRPGELDAAGKAGLAENTDAARRREARAEQLHAGAAQRIDSALYEIEQLRRELAAVIDPAALARAQPASQAVSQPGTGQSLPTAELEEAPKASPASTARSAA